MDKNWNFELSEYIKEGEPSQKEKAENWGTAIGLQDVDGLKPSKYLLKTAKEHIEGKININEVKDRINDYYKALDNRKQDEVNDTEEADKVSARIAEILSEKGFNLSPLELLSIHKKLFDGIFKNAGKYRTYNITKKEWILKGDTVTYSSYENIRETLEYDFKMENEFSYKDLSMDEMITHLSRFISNIWQVHPFGEGNTRTTAVFLIKYLNSLGFDVNDKPFAESSWYFRNALVRANYTNYPKNVFEDLSYLEKFLYNLLTDSNYELKNRFMHIDYNDKIETTKSTKYSLIEQTIINTIKNNPNITQGDIAKKINKSLRSTKMYMSEMQKKGFIERDGSKKSGNWLIKDN